MRLPKKAWISKPIGLFLGTMTTPVGRMRTRKAASLLGPGARGQPRSPRDTMSNPKKRSRCRRHESTSRCPKSPPTWAKKCFSSNFPISSQWNAGQLNSRRVGNSGNFKLHNLNLYYNTVGILVP